MRYYNIDGTFRDDPNDINFGWFLEDITVDEGIPTFKIRNQKIRMLSNIERNSETTIKKLDKTNKKNVFEEEHRTKEIVKIEPNVIIETPISTNIDHLLAVEGFIESPKANFLKELKNINIPRTEDLIRLINPINPEMKALLNVISYSRYRRLNERDTRNRVLNNVNYKATNSNHILNEDGNINFHLNYDDKSDIMQEIRNYNETKEDNMLSLMIELINTDLDSNLGNKSESNSSYEEVSPYEYTRPKSPHENYDQFRIERYFPKPNNNLETSMPRSDILNSIGLTDSFDRSIQSFTIERDEMCIQLDDIKDSFLETDIRADNLSEKTESMKDDLRKTLFLDNLIFLLNGELEKVQIKSLPFKIFRNRDNSCYESSFIV